MQIVLIMKFVLRYKFTIIGFVFGALAGYLYYFFVGCTKGTCSITSDPIYSTVYGVLLGGLLFNIFDNSEEKLGADQ